MDRDVLELQAELRAADDPQERSRIRRGLATLESVIRSRERQHEKLADLPHFWQALYGDSGDGPRFLALFSGSRPMPTAKLAAPLTSLYVDLDHDQLPPAMPPPSVLVASSPGRLQAYWRLTRPLPPREGEQLNRRLAVACGADASGWDLTQLLRIPTTINHKYPERPVVQLLAVRDMRYDPAAFRALLAEPPHPRAVDQAAAPGGSSWPLERLSPAALKVWKGKTAKQTSDGRIDRSASLVQIARVLFEAGADRPTIVAALAERDVTLGWEKYTGRPDAAEQYRRIVALVERSPQTQRRW